MHVQVDDRKTVRSVCGTTWREQENGPRSRLVLLSEAAGRILDSFDTMPHSFSMFTKIRFLNVDGSDAEKLMIGADCHYVGGMSVTSAVFAVAEQKLKPLLSIGSIMLAEADTDKAELHTLTFDGQRTCLANGKRFFFTRKV